MINPIRRVDAAPVTSAQSSPLQREVENVRASLARATDRADIRELKFRLRNLRRQIKTQS